MRVITLIAGVASALIWLAACQPRQEESSSATEAEPPRAAVDALDYYTARSRSERVSDVEYDLSIDLFESDKIFTGIATVRFQLSDNSRDLTLDFSGGVVGDVRVNDEPVRASYNDSFITLLSEDLAEGLNVVEVQFEHAFSVDGTGLHRFVDPEDGLTYLYTYLWPYYANRLFPGFDQPDLKAVFALAVRAASEWTVVSASTGTAVPLGDGSVEWTFPKTPNMPTYVFSLHAGPYAIWEDRAGDVPIRLMARRSLAEYVAVDEWFDVTRRGLDYYGRYFDIPYAFDKYDQLIVPDFNIGAMENIGAVTFSENYVQRQKSDRSEREARASVILHEMAHMWFGNLVTHDWWNGLWLNESFATQMAAMATLSTTEFTDEWHGFFTDSKRTAYFRDSRVTTHPIEMPVASTADFFTVFDAITYQKGSSVLKQLAHYVGEENYRRGVSAYLKEHAYSTTSLDDFIGHQAKSAGIDLSEWSEQWLYQTGFNSLRVGVECNDDGLQWLFIQQHAPKAHPYLRQHQVDVGLYELDDNGRPKKARVFPVMVEGINTSVEVLDDIPCPATANPNHDDWTYARVELREEDVRFLESQLGNIQEPLSRSIFLAALYDRAMAGDMTLASYVEQTLRLAETEQNIRVQQQISQSLRTAIDMMQRLRPQTDAALDRLLPQVEKFALVNTVAADDEDVRRIWFNTFLGVVGTESGLAIIRSLLDGSSDIPGVRISADVRWSLLTILSIYGAADIDELLAAEAAQDRSDYGAKSLLTATAARPDKDIKSAYLAELRQSETLTGLARQRAVMAVMFPANQTELQLELLDEVLGALPGMSDVRDPYFLSSYVSLLLSPACRPASEQKLATALDSYGNSLDSTSLLFLREALQADQECASLRDAQTDTSDT